MIPKGLFSQLFMIIIAVAIGFTYIQPTLTAIEATQNDIQLYQVERQKITAVNELLASHVNRLNAILVPDKQRLLAYMPDQVDSVAVPRALQVIANNAGVLFKEVSYEAVDRSYLKGVTAPEGTYPIPHVFSLSVDGTYPQIKDLLRLLEKNKYPLEVHELNISVLDGGFLSAQLRLVTYSNELPPPTRFSN